MYPTSKDYGRLWELLQSGEIIFAYYVNRLERPEGMVLFKDRNNRVLLVWHYGEQEKEWFIERCKEFDLKFIEPEPKISEDALSALDKAIEYLDLDEEMGSGLREIKAALTLKKEKESEET